MAAVRRLASALLIAGLALGAGVAPPDDADLEAGVRQVEQGDFEAGLLTLDAAARRLAREPVRTRDLARAHLYLGVAYVGLGQETLARARFRRALHADPTVRLQAGQFSARVLRVFEAARQGRAETATLEKQARRKSGTAGLVLLGLGGAAAAGIGARVVTQERENQPPTASAAVTPAGIAISGITRIRFTATATDPEGDPLFYTWTFGDNRTAFGANAAHVFTHQQGAVPRTWPAALSVSDGLATTAVGVPITVDLLRGRWTVSGLESVGAREAVLNHEGGSFMDGTLVGPGFQTGVFGSVQDPRVVSIRAETLECSLSLLGEAAADLRSMTGNVVCTRQGQSNCTCEGRGLTFRMTRQ